MAISSAFGENEVLPSALAVAVWRCSDFKGLDTQATSSFKTMFVSEFKNAENALISLVAHFLVR